MPKCVTDGCQNERDPHYRRCTACLERKRERQRRTALMPDCVTPGCRQKAALEHTFCGTCLREQEVLAERETKTLEERVAELEVRVDRLLGVRG